MNQKLEEHSLWPEHVSDVEAKLGKNPVTIPNKERPSITRNPKESGKNEEKLGKISVKSIT